MTSLDITSQTKDDDRRLEMETIDLGGDTHQRDIDVYADYHHPFRADIVYLVCVQSWYQDFEIRTLAIDTYRWRMLYMNIRFILPLHLYCWLEENSKGENSANNHVNTNVPILTDRRQVYISPNIEQTIGDQSMPSWFTLTLLLLFDIFCSDFGPVPRLRNANS
jgi:hypothetical protein